LTSLVLDSHVLVWLVHGERKLGRSSRRLVDRALAADRLHVSAVTFWEVTMLHERRRLRLHQPAASWRKTALSLGVIELPLDGEIAIRAAELDGFHGDPGDRFIAATAIAREAVLLTDDDDVLAWPGPLRRHDASK
jgi:PIN domain nuclease of toxin-antitoxin system